MTKQEVITEIIEEYDRTHQQPLDENGLPQISNHIEEHHKRIEYIHNRILQIGKEYKPLSH